MEATSIQEGMAEIIAVSLKAFVRLDANDLDTYAETRETLRRLATVATDLADTLADVEEVRRLTEGN